MIAEISAQCRRVGTLFVHCFSEDSVSPVSESTVNGTELRKVMTQREMKILTALFPKSAQTLACVLRKRPRDFKRANQ
jgi:hypothetical protein